MTTPTTYRPIKMIISGGGTGGHLFPAIAIAQKVKELSPESEVHFVGANGKIEMEKVPQYGFSIDGLWITGFHRGQLARNANLPFKVASSILKARQLVRKFKPDIAVGVGGYASGPLLWVAGKRGVPTLLQEQNSYPGITNKLLAPKASKICVAFPGMEKYFQASKLVETGNPIRKNIQSIDKTTARDQLGLDPNKKTLLVIGGSLGARALNEAMAKHLQALKNASVQVLWQTGKLYYEELTSRLSEQLNDDIKLTAFIDDMNLAYGCADLVVSRAGALSISEITFLGKPSILVPSPNVAEDHQTKNARVLVAHGAAVMVKDGEALDLMVATALELMSNQEALETMQAKSLELAKPNAAQHIAEEIFRIANG